MSDPTMTPVTSSNIAEIGTDGDDLHVKFKSGAHWKYPGAASHHAEMLKPGVSVGKYFHANVRGKHDAQKIE